MSQAYADNTDEHLSALWRHASGGHLFSILPLLPKIEARMFSVATSGSRKMLCASEFGCSRLHAVRLVYDAKADK